MSSVEGFAAAFHVHHCSHSAAPSWSACVSSCVTRSSWPRPDPQALLRAIAGSPRPSGSAAIESARLHCIAELRALGYDVRERPFEFSAFPGSLATPLIAGTSAMLVALAARWG